MFSLHMWKPEKKKENKNGGNLMKIKDRSVEYRKGTTGREEEGERENTGEWFLAKL